MPIYEYKGQQYDIATTDHAEAKAKILKYLDGQGAPKAAPAEEAPAETSDAMGADLGAAIMAQAPKREPKTYTGSVFDTQPFNPPFDPKEAERLSRRAYAEQTAGGKQLFRREPPVMTETPEAATRERTLSEANFDTWAGVIQGGTGFVKSILDNIPGGVAPGSETLGAIDEGLERLKTPQLRGSQIAREGRIARARELEGEVGATRAAYQTMFTPAGADIVARGAGSILPTIGMSLAGLGLKSLTAANALSNAGDAAVQASEQLKQISPEQWSKDQVYQNLRAEGLSHRDAVAMLAPIYAFPAQATGYLTGKISGATGLEKALTQGTERGIRAAVGRFGAEQLGEQFETLAPMFVGNLVAGTLNQSITPTQGLGQAAVETAFGALPGAGLAALPSKRINTLNAYAQSKGYADVQDMIRKVVPKVGQGSVEQELIDALDREADAADVAQEDAQREAETERAAIQGETAAITPTEEGPEPPDIFGVKREVPAVTPAETAAPTSPTPAVEEPSAAGTPETVTPKETPLRGWMSGINPALDKFYDSVIDKPLEEIPEELRRAKVILDSFNDGITFVKDALSRWDHPALRFKTPSQRAAAKTKATAEERELLDLEGELAGLGVRVANQFMALTKGYKGKKAGSMEKIDAAEAEALKLFERAMDLLYDRGLLDEATAADYEENKGITKPEASVEPKEKISFNPKEKTDEQLEDIVDDFIGVWEPEEVKAAKDELEQRKGVSPQRVQVDKPAPITDLQQPEEGGDTTTPAPVEDKPYYGSDEINALGDKIKDAVNKITSDFMVGDVVRYGTTNGVVVGVDDTHAKVHPDGAKSAKAYHRIPKANLTLIGRPDLVSKTAAMAMPGEDKKFGAEQGKLNADLGGLVQLLGANMYAASVAENAIKELLQNAFDAVKGAVSKIGRAHV